MKRFLTFYGAVWYPQGGMLDFIGDFDTKEEAVEAIKKAKAEYNIEFHDWDKDWASIWDSETREEVFQK